MKFLTCDEIADALGVTSKSVRRWISDKALPAYRIGRLLRVHESDLQAFLDQRQTPSKAINQIHANSVPGRDRDSVDAV